MTVELPPSTWTSTHSPRVLLSTLPAWADLRDVLCALIDLKNEKKEKTDMDRSMYRNADCSNTFTDNNVHFR